MRSHKNTAAIGILPPDLEKRPTDYGLIEFDDLKTSTSTVMVYTNMVFDTHAIFNETRITDVEIPLTKKQKNVDKKKIVAPYGAIVSVQSKTEIRGADIRKKKKQWCTICQPIKVVDGEEKKVLTVTEFLEPQENTDAMAIIYFCSRCQKNYYPWEMKKINHFLNQVTFVVSVGDQPLLNIMMFRDNFKIAGCKDKDDAVEAILILWQDYIMKSTSWRLKKGYKKPKFAFETVMRNVDFKLGFPIERPALNALMNDARYVKWVAMSQYESTGHTNVNIKMRSIRPADFTYECLVFPKRRKPYFINITKVPFKKDKPEKKYVTFIVFSSSEIILSGRYYDNMKEMYEFFVSTIFSNKHIVCEHLHEPDQKKIKKLSQITNTKGVISGR